MERKKIMLLEFNEISPILLDKWMSEGWLPNFKKFYENSEVFITEADETDPVNLEPWIQWYSMHTGLSYKQHKVFHLTDGPKAGHEDIWEILINNGKRVCNFSSMNAKGFNSTSKSIFLPDPWCTSEKASPAQLDAFHRVVSNRVQEYTSKDRSLSKEDYISFLRFLGSHGLRMKTILNILRQLISDTIVNKNLTWKRVVLLDKLQFDVFRYYQRKFKPNFSTFFINSTAHYQHAYWRHMSPEDFKNQPSSSERSKYKDCILFGYQEMDKLLGDFFKFEKDDVILILASVLSGQPYLKKEDIGGQHFYRLKDAESQLEMLGINYEKVFPVMTHQYSVHFKNNTEKEHALKVLKSMNYNGEEVFGFHNPEPSTLYFGNQLSQVIPKSARIDMRGKSTKSYDYYDLFYKLSDTKSGCHQPDGVLWFKTGKHKIHDKKVSILDVFPTILNYYDIQTNFHEGNLRKGKNLVNVL